jgi:hypothetical protein
MILVLDFQQLFGKNILNIRTLHPTMAIVGQCFLSNKKIIYFLKGSQLKENEK